MNLSDGFSYIALFAITLISVFIYSLLLSVKKKGTARVSFITFLSVVILAISSLVCGLMNLQGNDGGLMLFLLVLIVGLILYIPYCIMLSTFEPKEIMKLVPQSENEETRRIYQSALGQKNESEGYNESEADSKMMQFISQFSAKASESFSSKNGMTDLLDYINKTIRDEVKADGGAILLVDDFEDVITVKSFDGDFPPPYKLPSDMPHKPIRIATNFKFASFPLRENIFGEVATAGKPELITKPEEDSRIFQNGPEEFLECGSYIFAPLKIQDTVIGVLALARTKANPKFTENEFKIVTKICDFAASSIKSVVAVKDILEHNDLLKETEIASNIQQMLHPTKLPAIPGLQLGSIWNPECGVCGDYYDVIVSRKDRITFIMSDVAGKGINSVVVMTMLRAMIRLVVNTKKTAGTILEWVNHAIAVENFSTDHFASCALINYDPVKKQIEVATGGTTPVFYYNSGKNTIERISEVTEPIGVDKDAKYKDILQDMKSGDIIITYTDGLVEALNAEGQQYPKENMLKIVSTNNKSSSKDIANLVKADIKKFIGESSLHDDQSLLVIKF